MNTTVVSIFFFISAAICFGFIAFLVYYGKDGWGWMLFVWLVLFGSVKIKRDDCKCNRTEQESSKNQ